MDAKDIKPELLKFTFEHVGKARPFELIADEGLAEMLRKHFEGLLRSTQEMPTPNAAHKHACFIAGIVRELEFRAGLLLLMKTCYELRQAGYPQEGAGDHFVESGDYIPTERELIFMLGDNFGVLERFHGGGFGAYIPNDCAVAGLAPTPALALMKLWLLVGTDEQVTAAVEQNRRFQLANQQHEETEAPPAPFPHEGDPAFQWPKELSEMPVADVFHLPGCVFNYCPQQGTCKQHGCQHPSSNPL